jgi:hypothetical protein
MPQQPTPAKLSTDITVITIGTAIAAALGAFAILRPKLAIGATMKRETGSVEPGFRFIYAFPQYLNAILIALLFLALIATFARANIALFGCVLEAIHYQQRWSSPEWAEFYAGLAAIHAKAKLFEPDQLQKGSADQFVALLRNELAAEMSKRSQPVPQGNYLAAADSIASIWLTLNRCNGSVLRLVPVWGCLFGGRLYWLDRRLSKLPMLDSDGMRPQLIKLLARWQTIPWVKASAFIQPFSKRLGWLLLQETALRVLPEQKDVTFLNVGDVQLTRIACVELFERAKEKIRHGQSEEAKSIDRAYPLEWDLFAAADYCLWNLASKREAAGRADKWDAKKGWRWKLEDGRASKIS